MSTPQVVEDIYPLSSLQEGMLFHSLYDAAAGEYFQQLCCRFDGAIEADALRRAWEHVVEAQPVLRSAFHWQRRDEPFQVVYRTVPLPWTELDWRELPAAEHQRALEAFLRADRERGFDLDRPPLLRLALLRTGEGEHRFVFSHHHLLLDGWSLPVLLRQVFGVYRALCQGEPAALPPSLPYREYVAWLRRQDVAAAERFWRGELSGFRAATPLGLPTPAGQDAPAEVRRVEVIDLGTELTGAVRELARRSRLTGATILQGAWALLLGRYSAEPEVLFGNVVACRPPELAGADSMVGLCINTLPQRVRLPRDGFLLPWLRALQERQQEARRFDYAPLPRIRAWSEVAPGAPLFESVLVYENFPMTGIGEVVRGLDVTAIDQREQTHWPLTLVVIAEPRLTLRLLYDSRRLGRDAVLRLAGHLRQLLAGMAAHPDSRLDGLPLVPAAERQQLLADWNATARPYPRDRSIPELFEEWVDRRPGAVAVSMAGRSLTYRELDEAANGLAGRLSARGIRGEAVVGLFAERSPEMVAGMLGILKAGGAYLPLDPRQPPARLQAMIEDAGAEMIVAPRQLAGALPVDTGRLVPVEGAGSRRRPAAAVPGGGDRLAYVMFTSGSTGRPKGIACCHRGVIRLVRNTDFARFGPDEVLLHASASAFDASVMEVWGALLGGGRVEVMPPGPLDLERLAATVEAAGVTTLWLTAGLFHRLVDTGLDRLCGLRQLLAGGDALSLPHLERARQQLPQCTLVNGYGPTENTTFSCAHVMAPGQGADGRVQIGRPIANSRAYVLDAWQGPSPVGVAGEIYLAGDGLARGYCGQPALTAERFVPDPFAAAPGERLYRSGDLGRWLPGGGIEFLGRRDRQLKQRGFRIEPQEIEAALAAHPALREAAVAARRFGDSGEPRLVAWVVPRAAPPPAAAALRAWLAERLPEFMLPAAFVTLAALPLNAAGKVAAGDLPDPGGQHHGERRPVSPRGGVEEQLCRIWSEVLGVGEVGVEDDFFELGGDSILSLHICSRAARQGLRISPRQLFELPTVAALAAALGGEAASGGVAAAPPAEQGLVTGELPLTPIQRWFFERLPEAPDQWNQSLLLMAEEDLAPAVLRRALGALLSHHDALRLRFEPGENGWRQRIAGLPERVPFLHLDLGALPAAARARGLRQAAAALQRSLDLRRGPVLRAAWLDLGRAERPRLLLTAHHLAVDAVSWRLLLEDLSTAYRQAERGERPRLPPKTLSYKGWAEGLARQAASAGLSGEADFWLAQGAGARLPLDLPAAGERGESREGSVDQVSWALGAEDTTVLLRALPGGRRGSLAARPEEALASAWLVALQSWTGGDRQLLDVERHGREAEDGALDVSRTAGWFTSIFPLAFSLPPAGAAPRAVLAAVRERWRAVPRGGAGYGLLRYLGGDGELRRRLAALPRPEVSFNYLGQIDAGAAALGGVPLRLAPEPAGPMRDPRARRPHLLELSARVVDCTLRLELRYSRSLHTRATALGLLRRCAEELGRLLAGAAGGEAAAPEPLAAAVSERDLRGAMQEIEI